MATTLSKPPRSSRSNFFHDLVTVDFHQTDINTGVRLAAILVIITVVGFITGHTAESGLVTIGALYVLIVDQLPHKGTRTRFLLKVSILYASIFAIGMVISMSGNLVVRSWSWIIHHSILRRYIQKRSGPCILPA